MPGLPLVAARDYLTDPLWAGRKGLKVLNLCRDRDYLDVGYYCSLLAEERGHRILPGVRTINDLAADASVISRLPGGMPNFVCPGPLLGDSLS